MPDSSFVDGVAETPVAIYDAAQQLGADVLVLVVGGVARSRHRVADAVGELAAYARERGVRLGLEPLHPRQCAERSELSTVEQAPVMAEEHPVDAVGVIVDEFHVWWDPTHRHLRACVEAAGYTGPIEVEVFNAELWQRPNSDVLADVITSYRDHVRS